MTFELFTDRSRMVVLEARAEAVESGHEAVGTEHILLGMLRLGNKFTSQARDVLRNSLAAAHALRHRYIGTEHLLLGLLQQRDSLACETLADLGVDLAGRADTAPRTR